MKPPLSSAPTPRAAVPRERRHSISDWKQIASNRYNHERFIAAKFFLKTRPISLNSDLVDSLLYTEKFSSDEPSWSRNSPEGCVLVSITGLLVTIALNSDQEPVFRAASVGVGRRRIAHADLATTREGQLILATSGTQAPIVVYLVTAGFNMAGELSVRVNSHSSFSLKTEDKAAVSCLRFLLSDSTESLVIGLGGAGGGRGSREGRWRTAGPADGRHRVGAGGAHDQASVPARASHGRGEAERRGLGRGSTPPTAVAGLPFGRGGGPK